MIDPPPEITAQIFPWVEHELASLKLRTDQNPLAVDLALEGFLGLLKEMRTILVQDLAALYQKVHASYIYSVPPFNNLIFREFAANAAALLEQSETDAQLALQNLPQDFAQTFQGAMQLLLVKQRETSHTQSIKFQAILEDSLAKLQANMDYSTVGPPKKRQKMNPKKTNSDSARTFNPSLYFRTG